MAGPAIERRLAAITAADIAGYSGRMEADEAGTLARLRTLFDEVVTPSIAAFDGRLFKTMGDGFLAEFRSALGAVEHARHLQAAVAARSEASAPALVFRIGISLGDVMVVGDDLLGNAVNIAARMEKLAEPGGICVSATVHEHIRQAPGFAFTDLGPQKVKGLARPVHAFALGGPAPAASPPPPPPESRPSIVVMPLRNLGGAEEDGYFADGMAEELTTALARIRWLTVIARNSAFAARERTAGAGEAAAALGVRYVLEGSVRRAAGRVRLNVQLLDSATGRTLWAERFEGAVADVFELQDRITEGVIGAIEPRMKQAEIERARRKRPEDMGSYDHYLRAVAGMYENTPEGRTLALDHAARALAIDPGYSEAHGVAAWCHFARGLWEAGFDPGTPEAALRHAEAVRASRTEDATTLAHAAIAYAFATGDHRAALEMIDRAIALNPSSVHAHGHGAVICTWAGEYTRAIELGERALRLSPFDPFSVMAWAGMAGARLRLGDHLAALELARKALQVYPAHVPSHLIAIAALMLLGRIDEARAAVGRFRTLAPGFRIGQEHPVLHVFADALHEAGLPDSAPKG